MGACRHTILLKFKTGSSIDIESNDHVTVYSKILKKVQFWKLHYLNQRLKPISSFFEILSNGATRKEHTEEIKYFTVFPFSAYYDHD